jgi:hypothetical protein
MEKIREPGSMNLPEPFQARGHQIHFQDYHGFVLHSLDGIGYLAVHRLMHRGNPTGVVHTHSEERKRGWLPRSFSPNGVRA